MLVALWGLFPVNQLACAQPWFESTAPYANWKQLASSADGTKLAAVTDGDLFPTIGIFLSTNSGATWTLADVPIDPNTNKWAAVASSADGSKLVAAIGNIPNEDPGGIYTSTDSGLSWHRTSASNANYISLASSSDGSKLAAISYYYGYSIVSISTNSGVSWAQPSLPFDPISLGSSSPYGRSIAMSADGTKLVAAAYLSSSSIGLTGGVLLYSTNSGVTWQFGNAPFDRHWVAVACSSNGTIMVAVNVQHTNHTPGEVYISSDFGANWTPTTAPQLTWVSLACSTDGTYISAGSAPWSGVANSNPLGVYSSTNSGGSWTQDAIIPGATCLAYSANGTRRMASFGYLYLYQPPASVAIPLNISRSVTNVLLYWVTNQFGFHLQQKTNVTATNWIAVTNVPIVTNGQNQVLVAPTNRQSFYRLASP